LKCINKCYRKIDFLLSFHGTCQFTWNPSTFFKKQGKALFPTGPFLRFAARAAGAPAANGEKALPRCDGTKALRRKKRFAAANEKEETLWPKKQAEKDFSA
jgi:hypothetical protein